MRGSDEKRRPPDSSGFRLPWAFAVPFAVVALYSLYLKYLVLQKPSGYLALSRYLGRANAHDFSLTEHLALHAEDLFVGITLIPTAAVLALALVGQNRRLPVALLMLSLLILVYYASMLSIGNTGVLLDRQLAFDALHWAWDHPASITDYASLSSVSKLAVVALTVYSLSWLASRMDQRWNANHESLRGAFVRTYGILSAATVVIWFASFSVPVQALAPSTSATRSVVERFFEPGGTIGAYARMPADQLADDYARMTSTPSARQDARFGVAAGDNVVLFILETATTRNFDIAAELTASGTLRDLADSSLTSNFHHSTYPYTSDAIFSILSSLYPTGRKNSLATAPRNASTGWVGALARAGYATVQYSPYADSFEDDSSMYRTLGFRQRYIASSESGTPDAVAEDVTNQMRRYPYLHGKSRASLESRFRSDLMAWHRMRADIANWTRQGRPFVAMYTPQIGHGPWFDLAGSEDFDRRGHLIAQLQMTWLSELVGQLRESGDLERTIIVVTADHGPRTRSEYPPLVHGAITSPSIRVPLLVYSKAAVTQPATLATPTSHIDIGPTLMYWLGIKHWQSVHAGIPFDQATSTRLLFFFGRGYLGADGFLDQSGYHSCEYFVRSCLNDKDMRFDSSTATVSDPTTAASQLALLTAMSQLQARAAELALAAATASQ